MLLIKRGVDLSKVTARMDLGARIVEGAFEFYGCNAVVTRGCEKPDAEREHRPDSKHYAGDALDFRLLGIPMETREKIAALARENLKEQFQSILKPDHLHVEFDPDQKPGRG